MHNNDVIGSYCPELAFTRTPPAPEAPFAVHPYGLNGVITSGASGVHIIGDPYDFLPSATMRNLQKVRNIIKIVCFYCFTGRAFCQAHCTYFPLLYISICMNFVV